MSFAQRFALVLLAAFFLSSLLTSLVAWLSAGRLLQSRDVSAREAGSLALYRLMPALGALALTAFVLGPGYFEHEQRGEPEGTGFILLALAAGGFALIAASGVRVARAVRRAAALGRAWMSQAERIDLPGSGMPAYALDLQFPLVAVLGILRPRLFVSRSVLGACSHDEMIAIVQHERAHVRRRDNAVRLLMEAAPDALGLTRVPAAIAARWHRAVEQRADDAAARRIDLASALVKVARAAASAPQLHLPASALYGGEHVDVIGARVRRLVGDARPEHEDAGAAIGAAGLAFCAIVTTLALTGAASNVAHALLEAAVSRLP